MQARLLLSFGVVITILLTGMSVPVGEEDGFPTRKDGITETIVSSQDDPIDPALHHLLMDASPETQLTVIVQFDSRGNGDVEKALLSSKGLKVIRATEVVPALLATGSADSVSSLSSLDEVRWVEWNSPLRLMMNLTRDIIKAQATEDRIVLTKEGYPNPASGRIDGSGVTVVVLDSGIDATHPDLDYTPQSKANPSRPSLKDKVIYNAKLDQGLGGTTPSVAWLPMQNTDTSSGHGTHCAGTVAGDGDASGGDKRGVAPKSWLIGISMGEAAFTIDEYSSLEEIYRLSSPGTATQENWNIRVVSNSWGPGFPFDSVDPNDLTVQIIEKLTYDNNVVTVFANGNDGGDGNDDQSNIFAKVPVAIGVAASQRNGIGMADFSSRGDKTNRDTWPDIAAPGVGIWSAAARATLIGGGSGAADLGGGEYDHHYLAISGTSMATPHVAGLVSLLFQAAPSLKMSDVDEDLDSTGVPTVYDPQGISPPSEVLRPIHESELILKLTSSYITKGPNLATNNSYGLVDRPLDYVQGYGLVDAERAVALALALQQMRDTNGDGMVDNPDATVFDALSKMDNLWRNGTSEAGVAGLVTYWSGEYASIAEDLPPTAGHKHEVWVPAGTTKMTASLDYEVFQLDLWNPTVANLNLLLDQDGDGSWDEDGESIEVVIDGGTTTGAWWIFSVTGNAGGFTPSPNPSDSGPQASYDVSVNLALQPGKYHLDLNQSRGVAGVGSGNAMVTFDRTWYQHVTSEREESEVSGVEGVAIWLSDNWYIPFIGLLVLLGFLSLTTERGKGVAISFLSDLKERMVQRKQNKGALSKAKRSKAITKASPPELAVIEGDDIILEAELL